MRSYAIHYGDDLYHARTFEDTGFVDNSSVTEVSSSTMFIVSAAAVWGKEGESTPSWSGMGKDEFAALLT